MVRSKSAKRFERLAHTVMILVTICIVLPLSCYLCHLLPLKVLWLEMDIPFSKRVQYSCL